MKRLSLPNPFGAPVYYLETTSSTMDEARVLAARGEPHGTVIAAGFQEAGRGRVPGRPWNAGRGRNLFCTVLLRYAGFSALPAALALRTGLAVSLGIEDFAPALAGAARIKWPNDVMIRRRKTAGILTEGDGKTMYVGIGVNVAQAEFPRPLRAKATSILLALGAAETSAPASVPEAAASFETPKAEAAPGSVAAVLAPDAPLLLLEKILSRLCREIAPDGAPRWRERLEERLYMRGRRVRFIAGGAGTGRPVEGRLQGIGPGGELLLIPRGGRAPLSFVTGELDVYG